MFSHLLAGVAGAVAAGAAAVLALRMRGVAPAWVLGVAGGVAVTSAAPRLGVDVGRGRPWQ